MTVVAARVLLVASVIAFAALYALAALSYPGGTWLDPQASGYSFWDNFLCDVLHQRALNGAPNPVGAPAMTAAMLILTAGLVPMWWLLAERLTERPRLGRTLRRVGIASVLLVAVVPLLPSDRFPSLHGVLTVAASALSLAALGLALAGLIQRRRVDPWLLVLGGALALAVAASAVLYVRAQYLGAPLTRALPASQKVAAALLLAWMLLLARTGSRKAS